MLAVLLISFILCLIIGMPIGFCTMISSVASILLGDGGMSLTVVAQRISNGASSFTMLALPLFIFSGNILAYGCTSRLVALANLIFGRFPGGIGAVGSASCAFGAVSDHLMLQQQLLEALLLPKC